MDSKSGKSWLFGSGKGSAGRVRFFGSGTNAEKDRSNGNWRYTVAAGKAKWKFRISVDGQGHYNPDRSEDLWGKAVRLE